MKVFVTGGTGHVGQSVVRLLSEAGHECRILSRDAEATRRWTASIPRAYPTQGDITANTTDQLAGLVSKFEAVIHIVGIRSFSVSGICPIARMRLVTFMCEGQK